MSDNRCFTSSRITVAVFLFVTMVVSGCAGGAVKDSAQQHPSTEDYSIDGVVYSDVVKYCDFYDVVYEWDTVTRELVMRKKQHVVKMMVDSKVVLADEVVSVLDVPIIVHNNRVMAPSGFMEDIVLYISDEEKKEVDVTEKIVSN